MENNRLEKQIGQQGEVMLEAAIIFIPVLILLLAMLSLSFWFYQEAMMTSVASEIAEEVATNLKYGNLETNGMLGMDDYTGARMFRMTFRKSKVEVDQRARAEAYASWRIPLSTLGLSGDEAEVDCKVTLSGMGRAYVCVTVKQKTEIFLDGILEYTGITDGESTFGGTAYAECVDLMGYTSLINFTEYTSNKLGVSFGAIGRLYTRVKDLLTAVGF